MELKRYVQINRGTVYDLEEPQQLRAYEMIKNGTQSVFGVKKTSDNILDLVEVGDLVEHNEYEDELRKVVSNGLERTLYLMGSEYMFYENIVAIYKRQPNGDYKRYEVK